MGVTFGTIVHGAHTVRLGLLDSQCLVSSTTASTEVRSSKGTCGSDEGVVSAMSVVQCAPS